VKDKARQVLASGTPQQKAALQTRAADVAATLRRASDVRKKLRDIAQRAQKGDVAAKKTARIFSHVMAHRNRVEQHGRKLRGEQMTPGLLVTELGKIVPGRWLLAAAEEQGMPLLRSAAEPASRVLRPAAPMRALPAARGRPR
jgi:hypothetical protein